MTGKYRLTVETKRLKYDFEIKRKYTVLRGDSGTGKSELYRLIRRKSSGGVKVTCDIPVKAFRGEIQMLNSTSNSIITIDEYDINEIGVDKIIKALQRSDNYFILITRRQLSNLSISVTEIYELHSDSYDRASKSYTETCLHRHMGSNNGVNTQETTKVGGSRMLKVYIERKLFREEISLEGWFDYDLDDELLETEFSKRVVKEIDNSELINRNLVISPVLGSISTRNISGGAKTLICMKYMDKVPRCSHFGDNCFPLLAEICKEKDIIMLLDTSFLPFNYGFDSVYFIDSGKTVYDNESFMDEYFDLGGLTRDDGYRDYFPDEEE